MECGGLARTVHILIVIYSQIYTVERSAYIHQIELRYASDLRNMYKDLSEVDGSIIGGTFARIVFLHCALTARVPLTKQTR